MKQPLARRSGRMLLLAALPAFTLFGASGALATHGPDSEVTVGSNDAIPLQNKQNEPAVAINPIDPRFVVAGANDNIDLEACNAGADNTCPFTQGVGVTGFQISVDGGASWTQPTYTGFSARFGVGNSCLGVAGPDAGCNPDPNGPIGTVPNYVGTGLISDGDPWLAFGPKPGASGKFDWSNGVRLYYANLTSNFSAGEEAFKGFEAIAVSRTDDLVGAAAGDNSAWMAPVVASRQNAALFSDKETIWADNGTSSPFFGNVYVCFTAFRSVGGPPEPVTVLRSTDGGDTWRSTQISAAANTGLGHGRQGCTVRTDSDGVVYAFFRSGEFAEPENPPFQNRVIMMARSFDGGRRFEVPRPVATVTECGRFDIAQGRRSFDGRAGARVSLNPSVDIANGAPAGDGPDTIALTWCDGVTPTTTTQPNEKALVQVSFDKGETWSTPVNAAPTSHRPDFPAVAISPDGTDVYLTYMNFLQPWRSTTAAPRLMQGVVRHADISGTTLGAFATIHEGATGDARGSSTNSLVAEFLGDYNNLAATNDGAVAVWNDVRNAADCPAIDSWRQARVDFLLGTGPDPGAPPAPQAACAPTFGNSDIFATVVSDPS